MIKQYFSMDIMTNNHLSQDGNKVWVQQFQSSRMENFMGEEELMMDTQLTVQ